MDKEELKEFHLKIGRLIHKVNQIRTFNDFKQAGADLVPIELEREARVISERDVLSFLHLLCDLRLECLMLEKQLLKKKEEPMKEEG